MSLNAFVQKLSQKYKSNINYNSSLVLSEIFAPFGSAAGAYAFTRLNLNNYLSSSIGGVAGNYISAVAVFGTAWYLFNRKWYSGNARKFFKDFGEMTAKNLVPAALSYLLFTPISLWLAYETFKPDEAAFYASILSALIFIGGSNIANQRIIKSYRSS